MQHSGSIDFASLRRRTQEILEVGGEEASRLSRVTDAVLMGLISLNVLAIILESVASIEAEYADLFAWVDSFSVAIFSLEYVLRVWSSVEDNTDPTQPSWKSRLRFMTSPLLLIDLLAILPYYLAAFLQIDLRFLRMLRLLRMLKLTRYSASIGLLVEVIREDARSIAASLFVMLLLLLLASSLIYMAEHEIQPDKFGSIPESMWWAVVTMTTLGYGDVVPMTVLGKVIGGVMGIVGMGLVALPAGILASGFSGALRRRRMQYEDLVEDALRDGVLEPLEAQALKQSQEFLALSIDEADRIMHSELRRTGLRVGYCPHCEKPLLARRSDDTKP